jgi:membrane fusion protein, heavy metal efflux system
MNSTRYSMALASLLLLGISSTILPILPSYGHGGHSHEFQTDAGNVGDVQVDAATAKRLDLRVESVRRRPLTTGIQANGQIEALPNRRVQVTTPIGGTLLGLRVKPGDRVTVGQALAQMTSPDLAELRATAMDRRTEAVAKLQQAQADLQLAQENYHRQQQQAAADIKQAKTAVNLAQERYDRDKELQATGAIPRRQVQESEAQLATAKAALVKAQSRLQVAEAQAQLRRTQSMLQAAQTQIALSDSGYQTRLRQLGTTANADGTITIMAPIAGVVADRDTTPGESGEDAGKPILTLVNLQRVQVAANIYEKDLNQVRLGQTVQLEVASLPQRRFTGIISSIGSVMDSQTRVIPVRAELDNPGELLRPGMFATLDLFTSRTTRSGIVIPETAVIETNDKRQIVFVQNGNRFTPVEVTLGQRQADWVEVTQGLFEGDRVVTQRANQLYAQSLRGSSGKDTSPKPGEPAAPPTQLLRTGQLPLGVALPAGVIMAAGMFWAGSLWANRRSRPIEQVADPLPADSLLVNRELELTPQPDQPLEEQSVQSTKSPSPH